MHRLTASIIIVIIFVAIGIVIFSSQGGDTPASQQNLSEIAQFGQDQQGAQQAPATASPAADADETASPSARYETATIETSKGTITLELYPDDAPQTVANFGEKATSGFYSGLSFHRVEDWVVQGGDPLGNGTGGGDMPTELNDNPFHVGSLGVARGGNIQISNDSQFFITKQEADWLNGQYTNFGIVTDGMDVVNQLEIGDEIVSITVE